MTDQPDVGMNWVRTGPGKFLPPHLPLDDAKAEVKRLLKQKADYYTIAGFTSDTLGSPHVYGWSPDDQSNLMADVAEAQVADDAWKAQVLCRVPNEEAKLEDHTKVQIIKLLADANAHRREVTAKHNSLVNSLDKAGDQDAVSKITWGDY